MSRAPASRAAAPSAPTPTKLTTRCGGVRCAGARARTPRARPSSYLERLFLTRCSLFLSSPEREAPLAVCVPQHWPHPAAPHHWFVAACAVPVAAAARCSPPLRLVAPHPFIFPPPGVCATKQRKLAKAIKRSRQFGACWCTVGAVCAMRAMRARHALRPPPSVAHQPFPGLAGLMPYLSRLETKHDLPIVTRRLMRTTD